MRGKQINVSVDHKTYDQLIAVAWELSVKWKRTITVTEYVRILILDAMKSKNSVEDPKAGQREKAILQEIEELLRKGDQSCN